MAKLERNSLRIVGFELTEDEVGVLTIPSINVTALKAEDQSEVTIVELTTEQSEILAREVADVIKNIIRYQQMVIED